MTYIFNNFWFWLLTILLLSTLVVYTWTFVKRTNYLLYDQSARIKLLNCILKENFGNNINIPIDKLQNYLRPDEIKYLFKHKDIEGIGQQFSKEIFADLTEQS